jgi:hypothetical protein
VRGPLGAEPDRGWSVAAARYLAELG